MEKEKMGPEHRELLELRAFLRAVFVDDEYHAGLPGFVRGCDGRYGVQSSHLAAWYNAWRGASGLGEVSGKRFTAQMVAHGEAYGIERERTSRCTNFVLDVPRMRAALH
jgi:hypothetical protein